MAFGLSVSNDAGKVMYSTENPAYHFIGKYAASTTTVLDQTMLTATFTAPGQPIVFLQNTQDCFMEMSSVVNTGGNNWEVHGAGRKDSVGEATTGNFYVFARATAAVSGFGLQAFDGSGICTLDTATRLLKISGYAITVYSSDVVVAGDDGGVNITSLITGNIPTNHAVCACGLGLMSRASPQISHFCTAGIKKVSSTQFNFSRSRLIDSQLNQFISAANLVAGQYVLYIDTDLYQ